jgi:hypothetical protein
MSARAFPRRCVWVLRADAGGWLVLAGDNGWLHGNFRSAMHDAYWLSQNLGLPIRSAAA